MFRNIKYIKIRKTKLKYFESMNHEIDFQLGE